MFRVEEHVFIFFLTSKKKFSAHEKLLNFANNSKKMLKYFKLCQNVFLLLLLLW